MRIRTRQIAVKIAVMVALGCHLLCGVSISADHNIKYGVSVEFVENCFFDDNFLDGYDLSFDRAERFNALGLYPALYIDADEAVSLNASAELYWEHYFFPETADILDGRMTTAYLGLRHTNVSLDAGLLPIWFGRGLIAAGNEPGLAVTFRPEKRIAIAVTGARMMEASPMVGFSMAYQYDFLESLTVFGAWYRDRDDSLARWLQNTIFVDGLTSSGDLYWAGVAADVIVGPVYCSGLAIWETGAMDVAYQSWRRSVDQSGYLADLLVSYNPAAWLTIGAFCFTASGGVDIRQGSMDVFISPMPYNTRTALFFNPGFFDQDFLQDDLLWPGGMTYSGVIAPGLRLDWEFSENLSATWVLATFYPETKPVDNRDWYGWESDFLLKYDINPHVELTLEADFFMHGNYFEPRNTETPASASRFVMGIRAFWDHNGVRRL